MKSSAYLKPSKPSYVSRRPHHGVYMVSSQNMHGEASYHFVMMTPQGRWLLDNLQASRAELIEGLGTVVASCEGLGPIHNLKAQMKESALASA